MLFLLTKKYRASDQTNFGISAGKDCDLQHKVSLYLVLLAHIRVSILIQNEVAGCVYEGGGKRKVHYYSSTRTVLEYLVKGIRGYSLRYFPFFFFSNLLNPASNLPTIDFYPSNVPMPMLVSLD